MIVTLNDEINIIFARMKASQMSLQQIVSEEIREFCSSREYRLMMKAEEYYKNYSDVRQKKNDIPGRANTKIEHPILKKLIKQKVDYLLSKDFTIKSENKAYLGLLNELFDDFCRDRITAMTEGCIKFGKGFQIPYFKDSKLHFMYIPATELIPHWIDEERTQMSSFIRFYNQIVYEGMYKKVYTKAEFWSADGIKYFVSQDGFNFIPDNDKGIEASHFFIGEKPYNWSKVPIVWAKYDNDELPLAYWLFELIDDYNWQSSITSDVLRDITNFIYILKGYGGQELAEFLTKLKKNKAISVDCGGGVDKLQADLNIDAAKQTIDERRDGIYDYGNGVDTSDENLGNASGVAIQFRYTPLDNECTRIAKNLNLMFSQLKFFIDYYFSITGQGDFTKDTFSVVFNMDMPINESEVIENISKSEGIISKQTQLEQHPYVVDVDKELARIAKERQEQEAQFDNYKNAYGDNYGSNEK